MLNEFVLLSLAHVFAVASPGADFAVVLKNTLRSGRTTGVITAIGVGCGISIHLIYTLFGIAVVLSQSEVLFGLIKILGALYLLWLAWQSFQSHASKASTNIQQQHLEIQPGQAFRQGFFTNVFNPKVTVFFLVLFTNIVSPETPLWVQSFYGLWLVVYTMIWFCVVAWVFSRKMILNWYQTHGHYFDWAMGVILTVIAIRLGLEFI